jgi:hypothetical protein
LIDDAFKALLRPRKAMTVVGRVATAFFDLAKAY